MKKNKIYPLSHNLTIPTVAVNKENWRAACLGGIFFFFETLALYAYIEGRISLSLFIFIHLAAVSVGIVFVYRCKKKEQDLRIPLILLISTFSTGAFGLAGFLLLMILYPLFSHFSTPFSRWLKDLFPEYPSIAGNIFERIKAGWDDYSNLNDVTPFHDIFSFGTLYQKQVVLDAIVKEFNPIYSPILKMALEDPSNIIRIQAAAICSKIDIDFEEKLRILLRNNDDVHSPEMLLRLAQHFDSHAFTGILSRNREEESQKRALYYYNAYLKKFPKDEEVNLAVARLLFRQQEYESVISWFKKNSEILQERSGQALSWYLEALYLCKEYAQLESIAGKYHKCFKQESFPPLVIETVKSWVKEHD